MENVEMFVECVSDATAGHLHPNGGGWVADTADVAASVWVGNLPEQRLVGLGHSGCSRERVGG
jgi:hypothetical protein